MGFIAFRPSPLIVALGDSITQFGADPAFQGFQALLSQDYVRKADVLNRGLSGWTTRWWLQYLPQLIHECADNEPVLVLIALGANDASLASGESHIRHVPLDEYQTNLRAIVSGLHAAFPSCKYLFLTPPAVDNTKWNPADKLNAVTQTYAKACVDVATVLNIPVIDTWTATQGRWDLFRDGVHPNTQGNVLFHQLIQSSIARAYPHLTPQAFPLNYPDIPPSASSPSSRILTPAPAAARYRLVSEKSPTKCIHVEGLGTPAPGVACHLWDTQPGNYSRQEWIFDGKRLLSATSPTMCMTVKTRLHASVSNGDPCVLHVVVPGSFQAQEWILDGRLFRSAMDPTKCLHLQSGSLESSLPAFNGDVVHLWDVQPGAYPAQEWRMERRS